MIYRNNTHHQEQYEGLAGEREQQQRDELVPLFVSGSPTQQKTARAWLLDYLGELDLEQYSQRGFLERVHLTPVGRPAKALARAESLLPCFQTTPREATVQALGGAAAEHDGFWQLLCIGLQGYLPSADPIYLAADAARVTVMLWDTPTAVRQLKRALKPIEPKVRLDLLGTRAIVELVQGLTPHPALHLLLPELSVLANHRSLKPLAQELQSWILTVPKSDFPIPTTTNSAREDLPLPSRKEKL